MKLQTKSLLLISTTLLFSGCGQVPVPCKPVPCIQNYPVLPVYRVPGKQRMAKPSSIGGGMYAVVGTELKQCLATNVKLRRICNKYAIVNKRVNAEYKK